jgi:hypothetical protein
MNEAELELQSTSDMREQILKRAQISTDKA